MNPLDANKFIHALNRIAEGATMLASAIEEAAWDSFEDHAAMPGARPIAAAQLAQPEFETVAGDHESAHQHSHKPEPRAEPVSLEQVRGVLAGLSQAGHTARVRELIQASGVDKLSDVDPAKYQWLLEQAEGITSA